MNYLAFFNARTRTGMRFNVYRDYRSMIRGIDRLVETYGYPVTRASEGRRVASAPAFYDVVYCGEPGWDRLNMFMLEKYALESSEETIIHEANHMSRAFIEGAMSSYKGSRRIKPPRGFRGDKLDLWIEELQCYSQWDIISEFRKWRDAGFPAIADDAAAEAAGLSMGCLSIYDPYRSKFIA